MEIDEKKLKEILSEVYSNKKPIDQKIKEEIKNYLSSQERQLPEVEFDLIKKQTRKYNIAIVFLTALSGIAISAIIYIFSAGLETNYNSNLQMI
jgi:hypothetical protein